jgi:glycosyltransferase involved in cell wall biosynthesis
MRLAVVNLTSGGFSGGYRKYLHSLMLRLRAHPDVDRLDVFSAQPLAVGDDRSWPSRDGLTGYRVLRAQIRRLSPDVVFIPTARWFNTGGIPTVVMVRNMEPLERPFGGNTWKEGAKNMVRAHTARRACRRADRVIAVSEHVRDFLQLRWHLAANRVGVVYHGIDRVAESDSARPAALSVLGPHPFLFTAGSIRPARGLEDVILALAADAGAGRRLVVAGKVDRGAEAYDRRLWRLARDQNVAHRIVWPGHLSADDMSWCFRNADLFVMTSRAEACPNIALEAMSDGALIVSGDNAPMPEFFGQAARYYRRGDAVSLARTIRDTSALSDQEKDVLRGRARQRAGDFDWNTTVEQTVQELRKVMA